MPLPFDLREMIQCELSADLNTISEAISQLQEDCVTHFVSPEEWDEINLAVTEALANAIIHGCASFPNGKIILDWSWQGDWLRIEITDPGNYLPENDEAHLPKDLKAESGRGIFLILRSVDQVKHYLTRQGHTILLEKKISQKKTQDDNFEATNHAFMTELSAAYETISALFYLAEKLVTCSTFKEFTEQALHRIFTLVPSASGHVRIICGNELQMIVSAGSKKETLEKSLSLSQDCTEVKVCRQRTELMIENGAFIKSVNDPLDSKRLTQVFICPIFFQEEILGCLVLRREKGKPYFSAVELSAVRATADFLGIVQTTLILQEDRERQLRVAKELELAASVQRSLLPQSFPDLEHYAIFGKCENALEAGGDYFDVIPIEGKGLLLIIADVMGKGLPAAFLATVFRTAIYARLTLANNPSRLFSEINQQLFKDLRKLDMFITAQAAYLDLRTDQFTLVSAGHCPALLKKLNEKVIQIKPEGYPIGITKESYYTSTSSALKEGDRLLLVTDGIYEIENQKDEFLGMSGLLKILDSLWNKKSSDFCSDLFGCIHDYSSQGWPADDRTVLLVERSNNSR